MRAMILAAGRGERMRPLSNHTPKPLLSVGDKALIEYHLHRLSAMGVEDVVINLAWLGDRIRERLGDGSEYGLRLHYSDEGEAALETAGGIAKALPLLGDAPFLVINGDVWCDADISALSLQEGDLAQLLMVDNPLHNTRGDFTLEGDRLHSGGESRLTFAGIGLYRPELFKNLPAGPQALAPLLRKAMAANRVTGLHHHGDWCDVGTPERLAELDRRLLRTR